MKDAESLGNKIPAKNTSMFLLGLMEVASVRKTKIAWNSPSMHSVVCIHLTTGKLYFQQPSVVVLRPLAWILWYEELSSRNQKGIPLL